MEGRGLSTAVEMARFSGARFLGITSPRALLVLLPGRGFPLGPGGGLLIPEGVSFPLSQMSSLCSGRSPGTGRARPRCWG